MCPCREYPVEHPLIPQAVERLFHREVWQETSVRLFINRMHGLHDYWPTLDGLVFPEMSWMPLLADPLPSFFDVSTTHRPADRVAFSRG